MAATNATRTPGWLDEAAKVELPASIDRVALTAAVETKSKAKSAAAPVETPTAKTSLIAAGFSPLALLPSTLVLAGITVAAFIYLRPLIRPAFALEALGVPLAALWIGQLVRASYRRFCYSYRITDTTLIRRRGPLYPRDEPLDLALIGSLDIRRTMLEKILGVGNVVVMAEESSGRPPIDLAGVRDPNTFARKLDEAMTTARSASVKAVKLQFPGSR